MDRNITIKEKSNSAYTSYYPTNHAQNVERTSRNIGYIGGDTLLEVTQTLANYYIAPKAEKWYNVVPTDFQYINDSSVMCSCDNFVAIFTPYNFESIHQMKMLVSYDGGTTWESGYFSNTNTDTYINIIMGATAKLASVGTYEVILMGQANSGSTSANTYKIQFSEHYEGATIYKAIDRFVGSQVPLGGV